jgi:hypothetical protein
VTSRHTGRPRAGAGSPRVTPAERTRRLVVTSSPTRRNNMPVILWLLGVPLVVVIALMLFHVI